MTTTITSTSSTPSSARSSRRQRAVRRFSGFLAAAAILATASPASASDNAGKFRIDHDILRISSTNADFGGGELRNGSPTGVGLLVAYHDAATIRGEVFGRVFSSAGCAFVNVVWDYADGTTSTSSTTADRACAVHPEPYKDVNLDSVAGKNLEKITIDLVVAADTVDPGQSAGTEEHPVGDSTKTTGTCARLDLDPANVAGGSTTVLTANLAWFCNATDARGRLTGTLDFPEADDAFDDATAVRVRVRWRDVNGSTITSTWSSAANRGAAPVVVDLSSPLGHDAVQGDVALYKVVNGRLVHVNTASTLFGTRG